MSVSLNLTRGLAALLRDRGISSDTLLGRAGLGPDLLDRLGNPPSDHDASRVVRAAFELTGDPTLGLALGMHVSPHMLSVAGQLLLTCPTIRAALGELSRFVSLLLPGGTFRLREGPVESSIILEADPNLPPSRFVSEVTIGFVLRVGSQYVSRSERAVEVRVRHDAPSYASEYERAFSCPVVFGAEHDEIVFPTSWLDTRQPFADESMRLLMRERAEDLLSSMQTRETVHAKVRALLLRDPDLNDVDTDSVARRIGMSPRCLRRRLRQEGVLLSDLVDELRREISFKELLHADTPIKQIADRVGFSEVSAFHRAFKRWTGMTPAKYRAQGGFSHAS